MQGFCMCIVFVPQLDCAGSAQRCRPTLPPRQLYCYPVPSSSVCWGILGDSHLEHDTETWEKQDFNGVRALQAHLQPRSPVPARTTAPVGLGLSPGGSGSLTSHPCSTQCWAAVSCLLFSVGHSVHRTPARSHLNHQWVERSTAFPGSLLLESAIGWPKGASQGCWGADAAWSGSELSWVKGWAVGREAQLQDDSHVMEARMRKG